MKKTSERLLSILMAAAMLISLIPQTIFTSSARDNYVECDYCGAGCGDDYICPRLRYGACLRFAVLPQLR